MRFWRLEIARANYQSPIDIPKPWPVIELELLLFCRSLFMTLQKPRALSYVDHANLTRPVYS